MRRVIAAALLLGLAGAACAGVGGVEAVDAWARPTPEVAERAALYVSLTNNGDDDAAVVGASASRCGSMEVHQTVVDDDVMEMQRIDELALAPGETVVMEPGGFHLMCMMVSEPFVDGETIGVDLEFCDGSSQTVSVVVEDR